MSAHLPEVKAAVMTHMNRGEHLNDNVLIVRAFAEPTATDAELSGYNEYEAAWLATVDGVEKEVRIPWLTSPVQERPQVRAEIVELYYAACDRLGIEGRPRH